MADRDAWWMKYLYYAYGDHTAVDRLIEWALQGKNKRHISKAALCLSGLAMTWFLASTTRQLRDRSTKALISMFCKRIDCFLEVLKIQADNNDPYILQRLYAVAYGCVVRSTDREANYALAEYIYQKVFANGQPPKDILLRDYAKSVIECVLKGDPRLQSTVDRSLISPPYGAPWPARIPSIEYLKTRYYDKEEKEFSAVWSSVMSRAGTLGDFGNYTVGSGLRHWSRYRLGDSRPPKEEDIIEKFEQTLTPGQAFLWRKIKEIDSSMPLIIILRFGKEASPEEQKQSRRLGRQKAKFLAILKRHLSQQQVDDYFEAISQRRHRPRRQDSFDDALGQRYIFSRVVEMGWTKEKHRDFESQIQGRIDRDVPATERIGKKYQWIAFHEVLALVADNFQWNEEGATYEGPWNGYLRDIDPSMLIPKLGNVEGERWWQLQNFSIKGGKDKDWVADPTTIPDAQKLLQVSNRGRKTWLALNGFYNWQQEIPPDQDRSRLPKRDLFILVKSYLIRKKDAKKFYEWADKQDFTGRWMPESHEFSECFLSEFPEGGAFKAIDKPYYERGWIKLGRRENTPVKGVITDDEYSFESSRDASTDGVRIHLPSSTLYRRMGLRCTDVEGVFKGPHSEQTIAFDPTVRLGGLGVLLVEKTSMIEFLKKNKLELVWTVVGEKQLHDWEANYKKWPGRLEMSGYAYLEDGGIKLNLKSTHNMGAYK